MNRAEFGMLGLVVHQYRGAIQHVDGLLTTAAHIHSHGDRDRAATIEACRIAAMHALNELTELIANERERRDS